MELENAVDFLENKTILVAGSAGFLAKIFIEKILRAQPNVKKLYLLLRATDDKSALHRFNTEVMGKELFKVIKEKWGPKIEDLIEKRIKVVAGDITYNENLGICDTSMVSQIRTQVDIIVNLAATTNFYERYDVSFNINTMGAKNVLNFAKSCPNLKLLLHVSTAYVSGEKEGLIMETPCGMEETSLNGTKGLNINAEKNMIEETLKELHANCSSDETVTSVMKDLGIQRAKRYGWPNTYVFTKAMGEMLLGHLKGNTPLVIIRPTIITSTYKQPFPGWVEGIRTLDSLAIGFAKGRITSFVGDHKTIIDLIPADMVVNAMIVAMVAHADNNNNNNNKMSISSTENGQTSIYQTGSSSSNPVNFGVLQDYTFRYFTKHPWIDKEGNPIKVGRVTLFQTMKSFKRFMAIRYLLPLKGLQLLNWALFHYFQAFYNDLERKIKFVMKMIDLYAPYLFFKGIYDDRNTEKLREVARESGGIEEEEFFFDPKVIDWEDYILNTHMPGVVRYVFK